MNTFLIILPTGEKIKKSFPIWETFDPVNDWAPDTYIQEVSGEKEIEVNQEDFNFLKAIFSFKEDCEIGKYSDLINEEDFYSPSFDKARKKITSFIKNLTIDKFKNLSSQDKIQVFFDLNTAINIAEKELNSD